MRCAIFGCNNDNRAKQFAHNVRFYRFPKIDSTKKLWIVACAREDNINTNTARVCSEHFGSESYERNLMHELLNITPKQGLKLKRDAVPILKLPNSKSLVLTKSQKQRMERSNKRSEKKFIDELLFQSANEEKPEFYVTAEPLVSTVTSPTIKVEDLSPSPSETSDLTNEFEDLKQENSTLKKRIAELENKWVPIEKLFTCRQIKKLQNPKQRILWSPEDISQAMAIRSAGTKSYRLLLEKGYPFPAVSTLKAWTKHSNSTRNYEA